MHQLQFLNPVGLKNEFFSTVRLGRKWAERTVPEKPGEFVTVGLVDGDGKSIGTAKVVDCWVGRLSDVPAILLECHHDPVCRTWSGLAQVLTAIYENEQVDYGTSVTVLRLEYQGSAIQAAGFIDKERLRLHS
jgi:hypothetical protein